MISVNVGGCALRRVMHGRGLAGWERMGVRTVLVLLVAVPVFCLPAIVILEEFPNLFLVGLGDDEEAIVVVCSCQVWGGGKQ